MDGKVFDSSLERKPLKFKLGDGQVIRGWDEGVAKVSMMMLCSCLILPTFTYRIHSEIHYDFSAQAS